MRASAIISSNMIKRLIYSGITWIDLESPSSEEVAKLSDEFKLHPLVSSELLSPSLRPKIDLHKSYIYLILHFSKDTEVDFILGKDFIITTRYEAVEPMLKFSKALSVGEQMHQQGMSSGILFYYMAKGLYDDIDDSLTRLRAHLHSIEESVYGGEEREMVMALANSGRNILDVHQAIDPHKDILTSLGSHTKDFYNADFTRYADALLGNYYKVHQRIKRLTALHSELRETNNSLLSIKQNNLMQIFTIVAFVTLIPSLISGIFGMNAVNMPLVGGPYDFWILITTMLIASGTVFGFFKYKKWL